MLLLRCAFIMTMDDGKVWHFEVCVTFISRVGCKTIRREIDKARPVFFWGGGSFRAIYVR